MGGSPAPAGAQIVSTTTTSQPSSTTTSQPSTTTSRPGTTTTTEGSTTTSSGTTSTTTGESTTTTRGSSTSSSGTTETTEKIEERDPTSTIPTPETRPEEAVVVGTDQGAGDISPIFPWLSILGIGAASALAGTRWYHTRPELEDPAGE